MRQTELEKAAHLGITDGVAELPERYRAEIDDPARAYANAVVYVAEAGSLVGVAVVQQRETASEIKRVWVDPRARGLRVGSALVDAIVRQHARPLRLTVWEWRDDAVRLYRTRGERTPAMLSPLDFLHDLLKPDRAFLPKALAVAMMSSLVCGVIGTYVVLRGMAFIGDAVAHAVFPGLAVAFVVQGSLVLGGAIAGILTAVLVAVFAQNRRLKEDSIIGVFFVAAFALGIVIISRAPGYAGSLQQFLFGSITGIPDEDVLTVAATGLVLLTLVFVLHKEFVLVTLDREMARAAGLPVFALDTALYVMVAVAIVISIQTIGNILVLALLITPAAAARLLTDRLGTMMLLSPLIGAASALVGLYLSWALDLPVGGMIVLIATAIFLLAWFFGPRHGLATRAVRRSRGIPRSAETTA